MSTATSSAQSLGFQEAMQKFGRFLSGMVLPNIGAFIAWGFLTALFIPTGWLPNEYLAQVGGPMSKWLIPLLLGYSGGAAVYKHRGGVVGTIATAGVIAGADIPMFLGAMIMGPLAGYLMKKFDAAIEDKIPTGFEMLVNNFSAGILGGVLAVLAFVGVGPVVLAANGVLRSGVEGIVAAGLLPLASVIIEPAKILFLNNAIMACSRRWAFSRPKNLASPCSSCSKQIPAPALAYCWLTGSSAKAWPKIPLPVR